MNKGVFNAEIKAMPSPWVGVKYQIVWGLNCSTQGKAGAVSRECGGAVPDGWVLCQRKLSACRHGETGQELLCRAKEGWPVRIQCGDGRGG